MARAYLTNVFVTVGGLSTMGTLYTVKKSNRSLDSTFHMCDPADGGPVEQRYVNEKGEILLPSECGRVIEIKNDEPYIPNPRIQVTQEQINSLKVSIKPKSFTGVVSQAPAETLATGAYYIFTPTHAENAYSAIYRMVEEGAFITSEMNLKSVESVYQLQVWNGYLMFVAIQPKKDVKSGNDLPPRPEVAELPEDKVQALIAKMSSEAANAYEMPSFQSVADIARRVTKKHWGIDHEENPERVENDSMDDLLASILG